MAASAVSGHRLSASMERTSQWGFSKDIPSDIVILVGDDIFRLHKFALVKKSGYIRRKIMESDRPDLGTMELKGIPGGPEAFEMAAKFCYGVNFEISVQNVAALRCAAEWLEMTQRFCEGNLAGRADEFIAKAALRTLPGAIAVLKSCEALLPCADDLQIVHRCVDSIGSKVCSEANSPSRSPPEWWAAELAAVKPAFFQKVFAAMKSCGASPKTLSTAVAIYAAKSLAELIPSADGGGRGPIPEASAAAVDRSRQRGFLESLVAVLPSDRDAPLPVGFLCCLLRAAIFLNTSTASRRELERRISAALDEATVGDLMTVAFDYSGQYLSDLDSVRRVVAGFAEREVGAAVAQRTARTVDAFVAEIATEEELPVSKFAGIAGALQKSARRFDDDVYRAVDIYLKAHPGLDEIEREKACSVMNPLRLSYEARLHASQNKRLPVQVVLHALYYDQLNLRGGAAAAASGEAPACGRGQRGEDALAKENEALRSELARMRLYLSDVQSTQGSKGKAVAPAAAPTAGKKTTFLSSVSKKLGKLNPFRHGTKDTSNIEDGDRVDLARPRRRRFSIS
ncbi:Root phototropism protein 2 [Apostasia shenzhenica]|uniref:Root phototropism protein 2 n=1 Tax=Apostasia shenzhenica TaxID=1088818 RepID=A0A2I0A4S4_9ASPA|nr:Root phototropism protein 2 [Apostasia shenzhenica]